MLKVHYVLGFTFLGAMAFVIGRFGRTAPAGPTRADRRPVPAPAPSSEGPKKSWTPGDPYAWFAQLKPYCNAVEVESKLKGVSSPVPEPEGIGLAAACWALAGRIDSARGRLLELRSSRDSVRAAVVLHNIAYPGMNARDFRSIGPMLELVLSLQPNNDLALYWAGLSEYDLGQRERARDHLRRYLLVNPTADERHAHALDVLRRLGPLEVEKTLPR